ncbi:MAG: hypothetical protein KC731_07145 [Myxococcales bacterium]|nr:hypothetical protein [Myxococcales bacterium]
MRHFGILVVGVLTLAAACGGSSGTTGDGGSGSGTGTGTGPATAGEGLPCDVAEVLALECQSCHGDPLTGQAPMALLSYDQLMAAGLSDPSKTMAQLSLERMQDAGAPMPPGIGASTNAVAVFQAWLDAGTPKGDPSVSCDPVMVELTCTTNTHWTMGDHESPLMHPGVACIDCHTAENEGPNLLIAGTVFPSLHDEDDCNGASNIDVEIVDAENRMYTLPTNSAGNFMLDAEDNLPVTFPIRASVVANGKTVAMMDPVDHGDCNLCHTELGAEGAPGRIVAP